MVAKPEAQRHYNAFGPYKLGRTLGQGEFGKVKLASHLKTGNEVAIKLIKKESIQQANKRQKLVREIEILNEISHEHIIKLWEVIETDSYIGMVISYASGGELFDHILARRYLKDGESCRLFAQLITGVSYLHQNGIVHRDLKLENLLLDKNRDLVITDFGFANRFGAQNKSDLLTTSCGSPCYAAPELVINDAYPAEGADIWSCGVILYAMLCGYLPFDDDPNNQTGDNINQLYKYILETKLTFPVHVGEEAKNLCLRILVTNPEKRATMKEIQSHNWLSPYAKMFKQKPVKQGANRTSLVKEQNAARNRNSLSVATKVISESDLLSPVLESPFSPNERESFEDSSSMASSVLHAINSSTTQSAVNPTTVSVARQKSNGGMARGKNKSIEFGTIRRSRAELRQPPEKSGRAMSMDAPRTVAPTAGLDDEFSKLQGAAQKKKPDTKNLKLKYHSGPIDQRAISSIAPQDLLLQIEQVLTQMSMSSTRSTSDPFKLKVVRGGDVAEISKNRMAKAISNFPFELLNRIRMTAKFGLGYNRGFTGQQAVPPPQTRSGGNDVPIIMNVMVHRISNLDGLFVVDVKRRQGDIWEFKKLYEDVIKNLNLKMG